MNGTIPNSEYTRALFSWETNVYFIFFVTRLKEKKQRKEREKNSYSLK